MSPDRVVIAGMMGAGKTTVGRALAERLGWTYWDNDAALLATAGASAAALLASSGATTLHEAETRVLLAALDAPGPLVLSAPASAALSPALRARLSLERVVWLRASAETLAARVSAGATRPFLSGETPVAASVAALAAEREPGFAAVASFVVDVDALGPDEIVDRIVGWLLG